MKDFIKVSVIIPTYQRAADISRAVDSVLSQTIDSFEVIVVDDNGVGTKSSIETAEVMSQYKNDSRVIYLRHEHNMNGAAARNTGIRHASGKYISFLDDDDAYLPTRLEKMYDKMETLGDSWGACYTGYVKHMANGTDQYSAEKAEGDLFVQALMRSLYIGTGSNLFFSAKAVKEIGFFNESFRRNQDLEYLIRILEKYKMAYVDEVLMEAYYDIRQRKMPFEESIQRENNFRDAFRHYQQKLTTKEKKAVNAMYDIDWIRICLSQKQYRHMIKTFLKAKIPLYVWIEYFNYLRDRKKHKSSYGFIVNIK